MTHFFLAVVAVVCGQCPGNFVGGKKTSRKNSISVKMLATNLLRNHKANRQNASVLKMHCVVLGKTFEQGEKDLH